MSGLDKKNTDKVKEKKTREKKEPTVGESIFALLILVILIGVGYLGFRLRVELLMIAAAACVGVMAWRNGYTWAEMEEAISTRLGRTTPAILIIWVIGVVVATLLYSGSIPMLIYYGIINVSPKFVLVAALLATIVFSLVTGTSWGSVGTVGIAFMGIAASLNIPLHITAAAIICGATFGDKLSPLSETTNLAAATAGVNLYTHIRSMLWTTLPATLIALTVFFIAGQQLQITETELPAEALEMVNTLDAMYNWGPWPVLPFVIILGGAAMKKPPVPTMLVGSLVAVIVGALYQGLSFADGIEAMLNGFQASMIPGDIPVSDAVNTLLNRGGIKSMVGVVVIIYCGYAYASILSKAGFLEKATGQLVNLVKSRTGVMVATLFTELVLLFFSGSSYPGAIMVPEMYKKSFLKTGMAPPVLSRTIEDVGTMMAAFVPWGSSGAFYITTLGVSIYGAGGYGLWYITGWLTPLIAIFYAVSGIGIFKLSEQEIEEELNKYEKEMKAL